MIRRPPRSTPLYSSAASDVYKRQELVHVVNYFAKANLHFLRINLQLIDQPVYLVNKEYGSNMLSKSLPEYGLGLGHCAFYCIHDHYCTVHSSHSTGNVPTLSLIHISEPTRRT